METKWLVATAIGLVTPVIAHRPLFAFAREKLSGRGMCRTNYRGFEVVTGGGVILASSATLALLLMVGYVSAVSSEGFSVWKEGLLLGVGMVATVVWGWQDDCSADQQTKGIRGHFGMLWKERRITSGMWKVWGGGSTAVVISWWLGGSSLWSQILAACMLAVSPNLLNLFDLRPVRAIKVYWLLLTLALVIGFYAGGLAGSCLHMLWQLPVLVATCLFFRHDAGGRIMLGDTGANMLGFCAGYLFVVGTPLGAQAVLLLAFLALHAVAEFFSISRLIERYSWLERVDRWGRGAEPE